MPHIHAKDTFQVVAAVIVDSKLHLFPLGSDCQGVGLSQKMYCVRKRRTLVICFLWAERGR